jgi:hypothetical protein
MPDTLANAIEHLTAVDAAPTPAAPAELIADKGYHSRDALKTLDGGPWKSRISEPHRDEFSLWHGDPASDPAVQHHLQTGEFEKIVPWLMLSRQGLDVVIRPLTESSYASQTARNVP